MPYYISRSYFGWVCVGVGVGVGVGCSCLSYLDNRYAGAVVDILCWVVLCWD